MDCPKCNGQLGREQRTWHCTRCDSVFALDDPRLSSALEAIVSCLPHPLAVLLKEYEEEKNLYLKLHRMCDAAEMLVRFLTGIAFAEVERCCVEKIARASGGRLRQLIIKRIQHPGFGHWVGFLAAAMEALNEKTLTVEKLSELVADAMQVICPRNPRPENSILELRNQIAHDSRMTLEAAAGYLEKHGHQARFEALWTGEVGEVLAGLDLRARTSEEQWISIKGPHFQFNRLSGCEDNQLLTELPAIARARALFLVKHGASDEPVLQLFPLQVYDLVRRRGLGNVEPLDPPTLAVQIYTRSDVHRVPRYTIFHPEQTGSDGDDDLRKGFEGLFPVEKWIKEDEQRQIRAKAYQYQFSDVFKRYAGEPFVGRSIHLREALNWLETRESGIGLIVGPPGMGKSAFTVHLSELIKERYQDWLCFHHFFKADDPLCSKRGFVLGVLYKLAEADFLGESKITEYADRSKTDDKRFMDEFWAVLSNLTQRRLGPKRLVLLLDGLDEIAQLDDSIFDLIKRQRLRHILWLCTTQNVEAVTERLPEPVGQYLRFTHVTSDFRGEAKKEEMRELPPLDRQAVAAYLNDELDRKRYAFLRNEQTSRAFLNRLTSTGDSSLPLYLKFLADDLRSGRFSVDNSADLPKDLTAYYNDLINRIQLDSARDVLQTYIALLAVAYTPLPESFLRRLLSEEPLADDWDWEAVFTQTLRLGNVLTRTIPIWKNAAKGHTLYHPSFRAHLLGMEKKHYSPGTVPMAPSIRKARKYFNRFCQDWRNLSPDWRNSANDNYELDYAIRHIFRHANEFGLEADAMLRLANDDDLVRARLERKLATMHGAWLCQHFEDAGKARDEFARSFCKRWGASGSKTKELAIEHKKELVALLIEASLPGFAEEANGLCLDIHNETKEPEFLQKSAWICYQALDKWSEAEKLLSKYIKVLVKAGKVLDAAKSRRVLANILFDNGTDKPSPEIILSRCRSVFKRHNQRLEEGFALEGIGVVIDAEGKWGRALGYYKDAEKIYVDERDNFSRGRLHLNRSIALLFTQGIGAALEEMELSRNYHENYGTLQLRNYWTVNYSMLKLFKNDPESNEQNSKTLSFDEKWLDLTFRETSAVRLWFAGKPDLAREQMQKLAKQFHQLGDAWGEVDNWINEGFVYLWEDDKPKARRRFEKAQKRSQYYPVGAALAAHGLQRCGQAVSKENAEFFATHLERLFENCESPFVPCYALQLP
jgi:NACHT domain